VRGPEADRRGKLEGGAPKRGLVLALLAITQLVIILDASIVNVALPSIGRDLDMGERGLQWVVNAYVLSFGGFLLLGGRAADLFGRRRVFLSGLAVFVAASLAAGLSRSPEVLVAARALQGLGGAAVSPAALSIIATTFEGEERNRALGVWGALGGVGGALGVLLGGLLTSGPGWPWIFLVNVPIGVAVLTAAPLAVPPHAARHDAHGGFDLPGALAATAGLVALVYAVVGTASSGPGSARVLLPLLASAVLLAAFVLIERRTEAVGRAPLVRLGIFRNRGVAAANLLALPVGSAPLAVFFLLSLYTQRGLGWSALGAGVAFLPLSLVLMAAAGLASAVVGRFGVRGALVPGLLLLALGLFMLSRVPTEGAFVGDLLLPELVVAVGLGLSFVSLTVAAVSGVGSGEAGLASGLINTTLQVGGAVGLAALAAVAGITTAASLASGAAEAPALVAGYRAAFLFGAGVSLAGALLALALLREAGARGGGSGDARQKAPS